MEGNSSSTTHDDQFLLQNFLLSDQKYAEELELQEALHYSSTTLNREICNDNNTLSTALLKQKQTFQGESSSSSQLKILSYCGICMEPKSVEEMFENQNCSHSFCEECVGSYLATKIQENVSTVKCPDPKCKGILEPHDCSKMIPKDVFDRWGKLLSENMVLRPQRFFCPFKDCSAMLLNDEKEVVTVSECPHCHRLFCAQCKVVWHAGVDCGEFGRLKKGDRVREDLMAMEFVKNKRWKKCPKCGFFVERIDGCTRISCRCGHEFCYGCGSTWNSQSHYSCATR